MELEIINSNFTADEIKAVICSLKSNKSPGNDNIPAEFIKHCKMSLSEWLVHTFNYIIEKRDFPDLWLEGMRSAELKSGPRNIVENYRSKTILPILEKVFEAAVYRRLSYVNEAFNKIDPFNGGFLNGSRTADYLFIINGLIQRQLMIGQPLYICFVDFSKAFDLVNRNILFYKLIKSEWHERVVDTLRSLYRKTQYRVKHKGYLTF